MKCFNYILYRNTLKIVHKAETYTCTLRNMMPDLHIYIFINPLTTIMRTQAILMDPQLVIEGHLIQVKHEVDHLCCCLWCNLPILKLKISLHSLRKNIR